MASVPTRYREAAERWGYLADSEAHKYGLPNGATLLVKIASGESSFNMGAVSSAEAKGATQFIPETRNSYVRNYGVDPWKNIDSAIHAAAIYMQKSGLAAYNPGGGQGYIDYILGQPVKVAKESARGQQGRRSPAPTRTSSSSSSSDTTPFVRFGLTGVLVLGGATLVGLGTMRMLGTGARSA